MKGRITESSKKSKSIEDRLAEVEKVVSAVKLGGAILSILGISLGGALWIGYSGLKNQEIEMRTKLTGLQKEYREAQDHINKLRTENADVFAAAIDKYDKMAESYLELRKNVTKASNESSMALEKAGSLVASVEQACDAAARAEKAVADNNKILDESRVIAEKVNAIGVAAQESQHALEEYIATKFDDKLHSAQQSTQFTVEITGYSATCSFIKGVSVPYSRKISGSFTDTVVVVPENSICIVKVSGSYCEIKIEKSLQGQVIVEGKGHSCEVTYA